jgi:hypothetical protein
MPSQITTQPNQPDQRVTRAIANSARRTGVDFNYLMGQARIESGMDPQARAATSSATGLYQFIDQTWLSVVKDHGDKHGLGWASEAISNNSKGQFNVADTGLKSKIFALRTNPEVAALMAGEFAADNRDYLEGRLGREMAPVDLYLSHFLGANGAGKFLERHATTPDAKAADFFPRAARANRSVFYAPNGEARSFDEVRSKFAAKLGTGNVLPPGGNIAPNGSPYTSQYTAEETRFVQPADYVRLASQRAPDTANAPASHSGNSPLNHNARLAYMLLASIGADI